MRDPGAQNILCCCSDGKTWAASPYSAATGALSDEIEIAELNGGGGSAADAAGDDVSTVKLYMTIREHRLLLICPIALLDSLACVSCVLLLLLLLLLLYCIVLLLGCRHPRRCCIAPLPLPLQIDAPTPASGYDGGTSPGGHRMYSTSTDMGQTVS